MPDTYERHRIRMSEVEGMARGAARMGSVGPFYSQCRTQAEHELARWAFNDEMDRLRTGWKAEPPPLLSELFRPPLPGYEFDPPWILFFLGSIAALRVAWQVGLPDVGTGTAPVAIVEICVLMLVVVAFKRTFRTHRGSRYVSTALFSTLVGVAIASILAGQKVAPVSARLYGGVAVLASCGLFWLIWHVDPPANAANLAGGRVGPRVAVRGLLIGIMLIVAAVVAVWAPTGTGS